MAEQLDDSFYNRADAHINLSNSQMEAIASGHVSASMLYASARFNAWVSACSCDSAEQMASVRQEALEYFVAQFRKMLEDNLDDYISNFGSYMGSRK